jgi:valyl-tRNA synthetase
MVRDEQGRKMSKQLGNSPDPLGLIERYSADGVRVGMLLSAPAGNDLLFNEKLCEQGRNFTNKIWNAYRLLDGWEVDENLPSTKANEWIESRVSEAVTEMEDQYGKFRMSDVLMTVYKLVWDDFCSWYLEMIKPDYEKPIDKETYDFAKGIFKDLLKLLHPFMPFITEEIWHDIAPEEGYIARAAYPVVETHNAEITKQGGVIQELVTQIRNIRNKKNIPIKEALPLSILSKDNTAYKSFERIIKKLGNISTIGYTTEKVEGAASFLINQDEFFIELEGALDPEEERANIIKELEYQKGFLKSVEKKLSNERFVQNAPEQVVNIEKQKKADAEAKIKALEENLLTLN